MSRKNNYKRIFALDNQAAILVSKEREWTSSFRLTHIYIYIYHRLAKSEKAQFKLIPGHSNISGNQEVEAEACAVLLDQLEKYSQSSFITLAYLRLLMRQKSQNLVENGGPKFVPLYIKMRTKKYVIGNHLN